MASPNVGDAEGEGPRPRPDPPVVRALTTTKRWGAPTVTTGLNGAPLHLPRAGGASSASAVPSSPNSSASWTGALGAGGQTRAFFGGEAQGGGEEEQGEVLHGIDITAGRGRSFV